MHKMRERYSDNIFNNSVKSYELIEWNWFPELQKREILFDENRVQRFHVIFNSAGGLIRRYVKQKSGERCASVEYNEISRTLLQYFHDSLKLRRPCKWSARVWERLFSFFLSADDGSREQIDRLKAHWGLPALFSSRSRIYIAYWFEKSKLDSGLALCLRTIKYISRYLGPECSPFHYGLFIKSPPPAHCLQKRARMRCVCYLFQLLTIQLLWFI